MVRSLENRQILTIMHVNLIPLQLHIFKKQNPNYFDDLNGLNQTM